MSDAFDKTFGLEILDRIRERWWTVVTGTCLGLSVAVVALSVLPKIYEARTAILVTPQRLPQDYVRSTVVDDLNLRLAAIEQKVLSRPYMEKIIRDSFTPVPQTEEDLERLIANVRSRVGVMPFRSHFEISFRDRDAERAAHVANMLAENYIAENSRFRAERAGELTKAMEDLRDRVQSELDAKLKEIAEFKSTHLYETKDRQDANLSLLQGRQRELEIKEKALALAKERLRALDEADALTDWMTTGGTPGATTTESPKVVSLRRELEVLRERYSDDWPEVKAKKRQLEEAEADARVESAAAATHLDDADIALGRIDDAKGETRAAMVTEVRLLVMEVDRLRADVATYQNRIERTPIVEQQLAELAKGMDVLQDKHRELSGKVENAKSAQTMEETQKGEQFEVIEKALPPAFPVFPSRPLVLFAGLILGIVGFVGPVVVSEILRPHVSSEAGMRKLVDVPIIVTVPRLKVPEVVQEVRRERVRAWAFSTAAVALLVAAVVVLGVR